MPLAKHQQLKAERTEVRELENRMKEEERARRVDLAARKELNKKRTEENARKAEVVQVVMNRSLFISSSKCNRVTFYVFFRFVIPTKSRE